MSALKIMILPFSLLISQLGFAREERLTRKSRNQTEARFLQTAATLRLLDWNEGMVASQRTDDPAIKKYAEMMLEDQRIISAELQALADSKQIALPVDLDTEAERSLNNLKTKTGLQFDRKFLEKMINDYESELRLFRRAISFDDIDIRTFAFKYLSLIHAHLLIAKSLRYYRNNTFHYQKL